MNNIAPEGKSRILSILESGGLDSQAVADQLLVLFSDLADEYRCDFDCDNCHNGGCGNSTCERDGCPEDNAAQEAANKAYERLQAEGHSILGCQACMTAVCQLIKDDQK